MRFILRLLKKLVHELYIVYQKFVLTNAIKLQLTSVIYRIEFQFIEIKIRA